LGLQINGKKCGVTASQDNDTLFVGNICKTWTPEAVSIWVSVDMSIKPNSTVRGDPDNQVFVVVPVEGEA